MKLVPKALEKRFLQVGSQEHDPDPIVIAKFFNPSGSGTWYATELLQNRICFGFVDLLEQEWGYFSLEELETIKCPPFNLPIERDLYCGEKRISEHCPELAEEIQRRKELLDLKNQKEKSHENGMEL